MDKRPYLGNDLTGCCEIWHGESYWPFELTELYWQLKLQAFKKSNMADGRHLEKSRIDHIYTMVLPTGAKFGMLMHAGPPDFTGEISNFYKSRWRTPAILKNRRMAMTDWREIWHCDTYLP